MDGRSKETHNGIGSIYKAKIKLPYFFYYNETAQDKNLTMQAKGLLAYLLSLPEDWEIRVRELAEHFANGRDAIANALNELVDHQYVIRKEIRESGKFKGVRYYVFPVKYHRAIELGLIDPEESEQIPAEAAEELTSADKVDKQAEEEIPYKEIIDYLNMRTGKNFKHTTKATRKAINGRWKEGFRLDDFKYVIDVKVADWMGTEYEKYLCPDTLFRPTNFEKYRNQKMKKQKQPTFKPQPQTKEVKPAHNTEFTEEQRKEWEKRKMAMLAEIGIN